MFDNTNDIFIDGTFYSAPKCIYQILIIRVNISNSNKYFTTCFILCLNKIEEIYKKIFNEINKNLIHKFKSKIYKPKRIHINFEKTLANTLINVWSNSDIKFC